jgi:4-amino-4-deoxy-L-arabinose transferase-like glycosyltransferase
MKQAGWRQLAVLLVIAFALRMAAGWAWQSRLDGRFGMGDSESYWVLGKAIAQGQPFECGPDHARVFRTPGYPLLLAPIILLAGDGPNAVMLARAEAALLTTLAVLAVWWLTRLLFDDRAAILAAAFATFYPGAIALGALILSEAPFCPLMLLQLVLWILAWRASTAGRKTCFAFGAGLAAGAATLMRPSWLLFTPFALAVAITLSLIASRRDLARHFSIGIWMVFGLIVAMFPWWIRNASVTGRFISTTLQTGASLYDGWNPEATGASNMAFTQRYEAEERHREGQSRESLEERMDRRMRDDAVAWARANPGRVAQLAGLKFVRMWNVWPNEPALSSRWIVCLAVFFTYTPLLILAIIGACRTVGRGWPYILCCLPAVYLTLLHVVFVSSIRYRDPAMLALLALAAGAVRRRMKDEG